MSKSGFPGFKDENNSSGVPSNPITKVRGLKQGSILQETKTHNSYLMDFVNA
jgi:hypothetical protein